MKIEQIEQRIQDIKNQIHSLDGLKESYDDVNVHIIEDQIDALITEKQGLVDILDQCFDDLIGL